MAGGWNEGRRPDGDTFYLIRAGQRDGPERAWERSWSAAGYGVEILEPPNPRTADTQKSAKLLG